MWLVSCVWVCLNKWVYRSESVHWQTFCLARFDLIVHNIMLVFLPLMFNFDINCPVQKLAELTESRLWVFMVWSLVDFYLERNNGKCMVILTGPNMPTRLESDGLMACGAICWRFLCSMFVIFSMYCTVCVELLGVVGYTHHTLGVFCNLCSYVLLQAIQSIFHLSSKSLSFTFSWNQDKCVLIIAECTVDLLN